MFVRGSRLRVYLSLTLSLLLIGSFAPTAPGMSDAGNGRFELTIDNIMRGPGLVGYEPRAVRWSGDGEKVYFQWKQASDRRELDFDTYVVNRDGSGLAKLSEEEAKLAPPPGGDRSRDKKLTVLTESGDVILYDHESSRRRALTETSETESNARFTHDQRQVYFTRSNNLYVMSLDTGHLVQKTDIRSGGAGQQAARRGESEGRGTDSQEFVKKEERELLDAIRRRAERREENEEKRKRDNPRKPFNLTSRQSIAALHLTPDGTRVVAQINETAETAKSTVVPNYVTESAYTENIPARTKVGDNQSRSRLAIISVETGDVMWVEHGQKRAPETDAQESQESRGGTEPRERQVQLFQPVWSDDGSAAVLMGRAGDNKERWIFALDIESGKTRVIASDRDEAWIGGPGVFALGWLADNKTIYFQSESSGYSHLYTASIDGGDPRQLTSGEWEVTGLRLSDDRSRFFLTTSEEHFGERHLYAMSAEGGERRKLTSMKGNNQAVVSPDEQALAFVHSYANRPPELYLQELRPDSQAIGVTSSPAPEFWEYPWIDPPIVTFPARDGVLVPARLYKPRNYRRGGPAVIFVHGAGYLQNVHRWWSSYFREYMFHHLLVENGYLVMDIDYRASAGYGRDWRTAIYRHMGGKDLDDHVDAARWMVREHGVDPGRIGIYGGSYGGFITLMALFTAPDVFAAGASLRPVTDWAHYNHPYTSNILNTPQDDPEAYRRSSPIYFAEGLKNHLLICHGMVDVNVHFQDTVRLVQRLIELRKENWELAVYPIEDHGFVEPTSWADEYKRIFKLFQDQLNSNARTTSSGRRAAGRR